MIFSYSLSPILASIQLTPEEEPESEIDCASHLSASKNRKNVDVDEVEDDKMWASLHPAKSAKHKSI